MPNQRPNFRKMTKKEASLLALRVFAPHAVKLAQEEESRLPLADAAENIAVPTVFGLGGYLGSKALGLGEKVGLPDWLVGPAIGLGAAMPAARFAKKTIGRVLAPKQRSSEEIAAEEQQQRVAEEQALLEQQSQQMLAQATAQGYGIPPQYSDRMYQGMQGVKYGSFDPAVSAVEAFMPKQALADDLLLASAGKAATEARLKRKMLRQQMKKKASLVALSFFSPFRKIGQLGQPKPVTEYRVQAEQTPAILQQAGQLLEQQQQKGMMQQAQQAAIAKQLQGYIQSAMPKPQQRQQGQR